MKLQYQGTKRDAAGWKTLLKTPAVKALVHRAAQDVASNITKPGDVVVDDYVTDRAASSVTIRDVRARIWQARDGVLTRAAAAEGLEVRS